MVRFDILFYMGCVLVCIKSLIEGVGCINVNMNIQWNTRV